MEERLIIFAVFIVLFTMIYIFTAYGKDDSFILELAPVGTLQMPYKGKVVNLSNYLVDARMNLYSVNPDTWEIKPQKDRDILLCSSKSLDKSGYVVNSIYDVNRQKVTVRRKDLDFKSLANKNGTVTLVAKKSTPRHIKIVYKVHQSLKQG